MLLGEVLHLYVETEEARLQLSKTLLEEALKHSFVKCRTVMCLLVSVAGAGKTRIKQLLFRWAPLSLGTVATPLAVRPVQAIRVQASTQGGQLQEVDPDQLDKILACTVAEGVPLESIPLLCCAGRTESIGISSSYVRLASKSTSDRS